MSATASSPEAESRSFKALLLGRVLPHALIAAYIIWFLSANVSTVRRSVWLFMIGYAVFTVAHTLMAQRRLRFPVVLALSFAFSVVLGITAQTLAPASEAGSYTAGVLSFFLIVLLWFSTVDNYWFLRSRWWYLAELLAFNAAWIGLVMRTLETGILAAVALSFPVLAYSLYILLFDYAFGDGISAEGRRKLSLRYAMALLVLLLVALLASLSGIATGPDRANAAAYSLLSKKNNRFQVQDRARLEDEFHLPVDSKELVFVANMSPLDIDGRQYDIGYYLKFHSLYVYDPSRMEFNTVSDEMEDPNFRVRLVPLERTMQEPAHLTVDRSGRDIVPPYQLRTDGTTTVYNVKLATDQNFGQNLSYRFISYPSKDSIAVGDQVHPLLGIHRLFTRVSALNLVPIGTAGDLFQFDFNGLVLGRIGEYGDLDHAPRRFLQPYLNTAGLEQDIVDTVRALVRNCSTYPEKIAAVIGFFTRKDADGQPVFRYDLKPGKSPDPNESLLHYFLLRNHRGYCTYYATAATLFFRIAGIPARVAVGFVPGEAGKQNPGWYFIYSNQAHAWTEVYLGPSLGWMDLDLTPVGENSDAPPPPPPTPPPPPLPLDARYRLTGVVTSAGDDLRCGGARLVRSEEARDAVVCERVLAPDVSLVFDTTADASAGISDARRAASRIARDLKPGDSVVAIGGTRANPFAETCSIDRFAFHSIKRLDRAKADTSGRGTLARQGVPIWKRPWPYLLAAAALILLLLAAPSAHLSRLERKVRRARNESARLAGAREWILLKLHLHGCPSRRETDLEYARRVEQTLGIPVEPFFGQYIRSRYYGAAPSDQRALCAGTMRGIGRAVGARKNASLRQLNLWEYIRWINRGKTA